MIKTIFKEVYEQKLSVEQALTRIKELQAGHQSISQPLYIEQLWQEAVPEIIPSDDIFSNNMWLVSPQAEAIDNTLKSLSEKTTFIDSSKSVSFNKLGQLPDLVLFRCPAAAFETSVTHINLLLQQSLYTLFRATKALLKHETKQKIRIIILCPFKEEDKSMPVYGAIAAWLKTLMLESPQFTAQCLSYSHDTEKHLKNYLKCELAQKDLQTEVHYDQKQTRWVRTLQENKRWPEGASRLRTNGSYLITGGLGGVGKIIAQELCQHYDATILILGRSPLSKDGQQWLKNTGNITYLQGDVRKQSDIKCAIDKIKEHSGQLHGVIHCAGVLMDGWIRDKKISDIQQVVDTKLIGAMHLDNLTKDEPLDCFVAFSSIASLWGNAGQADYAYANQFLDEFCRWRARLVEQGLRHGQSISINWPLWQSEGMQLDENTQTYLRTRKGLHVLSPEQGWQEFQRILESKKAQMGVLYGERTLLLKHFLSAAESQQITPSSENQETDKVEEAQREESIEIQLQEMLSKLLKVDVGDIELDEDLRNYGLDSITGTALAQQINQRFDIEVPPAVLFESSDISSFSTYLRSEHPKLRHSGKVEDVDQRETQSETQSRWRPLLSSPVSEEAKTSNDRDIAIIGYHGRFPGAQDDMSLFERTLFEGKNTTGPIPKQRKWMEPLNGFQGGFLSNIAEFDADFFGIQATEANMMDPQQRMLLEVVWQALEHAAYNPGSLAKETVGLFIGASGSDYSQLMSESKTITAHYLTGSSHAMLANRISYILNLRGPSEAIDTACSSSNVAIHRAVCALRQNECQIAIAGGVNLLLHPGNFEALKQAELISASHRIRPFDAQADGYVRGEGCGAVVLKSLAQAQQDGDPIHAVIKGSAVSHSGKGSNLTTANPVAQADVIIKAYKDANIQPEDVSYIEAQGAGTAVGDLVEINALKIAFTKLNKQRKDPPPYQAESCMIGSVKPNIGHLEAASGIASIIKLLLICKQGRYPALIHHDKVNPLISLKDTPFKFNINNTDSSENKAMSLHSFGFGGTNAHFVVCSYMPKLDPCEKAERYAIPLSAKSQRALKATMSNLLRYLEQTPDIDLSAIAYTLQVARDDMSHRFAAIVNDLDDLKRVLQVDVEQPIDDASIFYGEVTQRPGYSRRKKAFPKDITEAVKLWIAGSSVAWLEFYQQRPRRISLPVYPFDRKSYWFDYGDDKH